MNSDTKSQTGSLSPCHSPSTLLTLQTNDERAVFQTVWPLESIPTDPFIWYHGTVNAISNTTSLILYLHIIQCTEKVFFIYLAHVHITHTHLGHISNSINIWSWCSLGIIHNNFTIIIHSHSCLRELQRMGGCLSTYRRSSILRPHI